MWFCLETAYTRMSTLLSWVALWALGFARASVRARTEGCGSGSSLTHTQARMRIYACFSLVDEHDRADETRDVVIQAVFDKRLGAY
jgi:hypothetical protein